MGMIDRLIDAIPFARPPGYRYTPPAIHVHTWREVARVPREATDEPVPDVDLGNWYVAADGRLHCRATTFFYRMPLRRDGGRLMVRGAVVADVAEECACGDRQVRAEYDWREVRGVEAWRLGGRLDNDQPGEDDHGE